MRKEIILTIALLASAITMQGQNVMKLATDRVLAESDVTTSVPQKAMNSKLGMELQRFLGSGKVKSLRKAAGTNDVQAKPTVKVLVMLAPSAGVKAEVLESVGCKVMWSMKSQAFVAVPVDKLEALAEINGVLDINLPATYELSNDVAREITNVSVVADPVSAEAAQLPHAYDGSGVVVGVVDCGIDFAHPAFRNEDGSTRIKRAFTQRKTDEPENDGKNIYTAPDEILNITPLTNKTHGSHVMGIAAGSNTGNNLQGMAPGADLIAADLFSIGGDNIVSGMRSICEYAEEVGKPVVINFSISSPGTFRDGCDPVSQAMIELTDNGTKPGVIVSAASGNDGNVKNYVHHKFANDGEKLYVMMDVSADTVIVETETPGEQIITRPLNIEESLCGFADKDVENAEEMLVAYSLSEKRILDANEKVAVANIYVEMEDGQKTYYLTNAEGCDSIGQKVITLGALRTLLKREGCYDSYVHNCSDGVTKKREMVIFTTMDMNINLLEDIRLGACFSLPAGTGLSVVNKPAGASGEFLKPEGFDFLHTGTAEGSLNEATCNMANITVGAYNSRNTIVSYFVDELVADKYHIGDVTSFTSYGYTNDENHLSKPDVLAPGLFLLSAVNGNYAPYFETYGNLLPKEKMEDSRTIAQKIEYAGKDYWYEYMAGTSMATPVVTGIIALWLQADPTLSVRDIREVIAKSAVPYTGDNPIQSSVFGKIDALAGLRYITGEVTGIDDITYPQTAETTDTRIFTLDGRQVRGIPSQGIYIVGGKKVHYGKR